MEYAVVEIVLAIVGCIFAVLWYLLRQKDMAQAAQIELLFQKHDQDAQALQDLRVQIASQHYVKAELDSRFDRLEQAVRDEVKGIGEKFDRLTSVLLGNQNGKGG